MEEVLSEDEESNPDEIDSDEESEEADFDIDEIGRKALNGGFECGLGRGFWYWKSFGGKGY